MRLHERWLCGWTVFALAGIATAQAQKPEAAKAPSSPEVAKTPSSPEAAKTPSSYVRVHASGAKLKNLPDAKGETVLDAPAGAILAVFSERAGWLEVEPASGMKVWVHGSYLKRTDMPGVAEVTANSVRMRPLPASDEKSFPLPKQLDKGERVRVIARAAAQKPLAEDWVQVWSPPGARAFVAAADTGPLPAGEDPRQAWASAVQSAQASMLVVELGGGGKAAPTKTAGDKSVAQEASAKKPDAVADPAIDKLAQAEKLMATARASEHPDFAGAKSAYQAVVAAAPSGASAATAQARLQEIEAREEIERLKADKTTFEKQRAEKLAEAEAKLRAVNQRHDPLWGRLQARGLLQEVVRPGEAPRYLLRWGGADVAEIACGSGRYDLKEFVGFEIGIQGVTLRPAVPGSGELPGTPAKIDATRIEVISAALRG